MKLRKNQLRKIDFSQSPPPAITSPQFATTRTKLLAIRQRLVSFATELDADNPSSGGERSHVESQALAVLQKPLQLMHEYSDGRLTSRLGRVFRIANALHERVDRIVMIAPSSYRSSLEAIQGACCQPLWNELSRGDRGGKPRLSLVGDDLDNDSIQSLLYLLGAHRTAPASDFSERWGLVIVDPEGDSPLTDLALQAFLPALQRQMGNDPCLVAGCVIPYSKSGTPLMLELNRRGLNTDIPKPIDFDSPHSFFNDSVLLGAAILGVNVMELVAGAAAATTSFLADESSSDLTFDFTIANLLARDALHPPLRQLSVWCDGLFPTSLWYEGLVGRVLLENCAVSRRGALEPLDALCHRTDLQRRDPARIVHHLTTKEWRFDELKIYRSTASNRSRPITETPSTSPLSHASSSDWIEEFRNDVMLEKQNHRPPSTVLRLPIVDELHCGLLCQMLALATFLERLYQDGEADLA